MSRNNSVLKQLLFKEYDQSWSSFNTRYLRLKIALFNKEVKHIASLVQIMEDEDEDPFLNLLLSYLLKCRDNFKLLKDHIVFFSSFLNLLKDIIFKSISKKIKIYVQTTQKPFPVFTTFDQDSHSNPYIVLETSVEMKAHPTLSRVIWLSRMLDQVQKVEQSVAKIIKDEREHLRMQKLLESIGIREIIPKEVSSEYLNKHFFLGNISLSLYILLYPMKRPQQRLVNVENHFLYITYKSIAYELKNFSLAFSLLRKIGLNATLVARKLFTETLKKDIRDRLYYHLYHSGLVTPSEEHDYELLDLFEAIGMLPSAQVAMKRNWSANFMARTAKALSNKQNEQSLEPRKKDSARRSREEQSKSLIESELETLDFSRTFMKFSDVSDFLEVNEYYLSGFTREVHKTYEDEFKNRVLPVTHFSLFPEEEENFFDEQAKTEYNLMICERCYDFFHKNENRLMVKKLDKIRSEDVTKRVLSLLGGYTGISIVLEEPSTPVAEKKSNESNTAAFKPAHSKGMVANIERTYFQSSVLLLSKLEDDQKLRILFEFFPNALLKSASQDIKTQTIVLQYLIGNDDVSQMLLLPFLKQILTINATDEQSPKQILDSTLGFKNTSFVFREMLFDSLVQEGIVIDHELKDFRTLFSRLARRRLLFAGDAKLSPVDHFARTSQFQGQVLKYLNEYKLYHFLMEYILSNHIYIRFPELMTQLAQSNQTNLQLQFLLCAFTSENSLYSACEYTLRIQAQNPELKVHLHDIWERNPLLALAMLQYSNSHSITSLVSLKDDGSDTEGRTKIDVFENELQQISTTFHSIFIKHSMPFKKAVRSYDFSERVDEFLLLAHGRNPFFEFRSDYALPSFFQHEPSGQIISNFAFLLLVGMPFHALVTLLEQMSRKIHPQPDQDVIGSDKEESADMWTSFTNKLLTMPKDLEEVHKLVREDLSSIESYLREVYDLSLARPLDELYNRSVKRFLTFLGIESKSYEIQMSSIRRIYLHQYFKKTNTLNALTFADFTEYFFSSNENHELFLKFYDKHIIQEIFTLFAQLEPPFKDLQPNDQDPRDNFSSLSSVLLNILRFLESATRDLEFKINDFSLDLSKREELAKHGSPWKLVNEFCLINNLPVSLTLLHELARNNDWMMFLFECERQQCDQKTIVETIDKYFEDPCLKSHLLIVLSRLSKPEVNEEDSDIKSEKALLKDFARASEEFYEHAKGRLKRSEQVGKEDEDIQGGHDSSSSIAEYSNFVQKRLGYASNTQDYYNHKVMAASLLKVSALRRQLFLPYLVSCLAPEKKLESFSYYLYISFQKAQNVFLDLDQDTDNTEERRSFTTEAMEKLEDILRALKTVYNDDNMSMQFMRDTIMWLTLVLDRNLLMGMQLFCPDSPYIHFYRFWAEFKLKNYDCAYQYLLKYQACSESNTEESNDGAEGWIFSSKLLRIARKVIDNAINHNFCDAFEAENLLEMLYHSQFDQSYEDYYIALSFINKIKATNASFIMPKLTLENLSNSDAILMNLLRNELTEEALAFAEYFDYNESVLVTIELLHKSFTLRANFLDAKIDEPLFVAVILEDIWKLSWARESETQKYIADMIMTLLLGVIENADPKLQSMKVFLNKLGEIFEGAEKVSATPHIQQNELSVSFLNYLIDFIWRVMSKGLKDKSKELKLKRLELFVPFINSAIKKFLLQFELLEVAKSLEVLRLLEDYNIGGISAGLQSISFFFKSKAVISGEDYERLKEAMLSQTERKVLSCSFDQASSNASIDEPYLLQIIGKQANTKPAERSKSPQPSSRREKNVEYTPLNKLVHPFEDSQQLFADFWKIYLPLNEIINILNGTLKDRSAVLYSITECQTFLERERPRIVISEILRFIKKKNMSIKTLESSGRVLCSLFKLSNQQQRYLVLDVLTEDFLETFEHMKSEAIDDDDIERIFGAYTYLVSCQTDPRSEQVIMILLNFIRINYLSTPSILHLVSFILFLIQTSGAERDVKLAVGLVMYVLKQLKEDLRLASWGEIQTQETFFLSANLLKLLLFIGLKVQNLTKNLIILITRDVPGFVEPLIYNLKHPEVKLLLLRSQENSDQLLRLYSENGMKVRTAKALLTECENIFRLLLEAADKQPEAKLLSSANLKIVFNLLPKMLNQQTEYSLQYVHSALTFLKLLEKVYESYQQALLFRSAIKYRRMLSYAFHQITKGFDKLSEQIQRLDSYSKILDGVDISAEY